MNFESKAVLYPERPSSGLDDKLEFLMEMERGGAGKIELSAEEKEVLLCFENDLGQELEATFSIVSPSETFYLDYFLTEEGKEDLRKITGSEESNNSLEEVEAALLKNRNKLKDLLPADRKKIVGRSESMADGIILEKLLRKYRQSGELAPDSMHPSKRVSISVAPEKSLQKITQLRNFKDKLKGLIVLESSGRSSNLSLAKNEILILYKRRVNELIADQFEGAVRIKKMADSLGSESLTKDEQDILEAFSGLGFLERNLSRFDKFLHGSSQDVDSSGMYGQIGREIEEFVKKTELEYIKNALGKERLIAEKGLDSKALLADKITPDEFSELANEVLDAYGLRSAEAETSYDPDRTGTASDGKWQFISRPEYKSMAVNGRQKVIKSENSNKNIVDVIATLLGHEIEGHVLQNENRSGILLRLFDKIGAGRSQIFSEGGAMFNEDIICREAFGFRNIPHAHYIRAMVRKLEGGNYLDCVSAFFKSSQIVTERKRDDGIFDEEGFWQETENNLKIAINRCKRLFQSSLDWNNSSRLLSRSKDTVYIEQLILLEKLKKAGLEKYAYVGGANLDTLASLAKLGMLDPSKIKKPSLHALKIWERIRPNFILERK